MQIKTPRGNSFFLPDKYAKEKSSRSNFSLAQRLQKGMWEQEEIEILEQNLHKDDAILELGACIGVLGVNANKMLTNKKNHLLIEANPNMIPIIEKNKALNKSKFSIRHCMIGDPKKDDGSFVISNFILGSSAYLSGKKIKVDVVPLSEFTKDFNFLIIDIEGGEYKLIDEMIEDIKKFKKLIVEFHPFFGFTEEDVNSRIEALAKAGFDIKDQRGMTYYFIKRPGTK